MRRCCFLTLEERGNFVIDDELALPAMQRAGWRVDTLPWRQRERDWAGYDLVILRSTWDYWDDVDEFLQVLETIDQRTRLANSLSLVHWNLNKRYLAELAGQGVQVLPTRWHDQLGESDLRDALHAYDGAELVVKPQVGGNGQDCFRIPPDLSGAPVARALERFSGTPCMLQPFRGSVVTHGEYSLFFFAGRFSHAINKLPAAGEFRSQEERGAQIAPHRPAAALRGTGQRAVDALPECPLYARADLLAAPGGGFELVELELIEPALYFRTDTGAPGTFAAAVTAWADGKVA